MPDAAVLIVFGGLPGTGKTTLAQVLAEQRGAAYLRIDAIEQALRESGMLAGDVGPAGYLVAYALADANLRLGLSVIADSVNPLAVTRDAWRRVAAAASARLVEIEVICSDAKEHRRRVETRTIDLPGLTPPSWAQVLDHDYEPWGRPRFVLDTALVSPADALDRLRARIDGET
ncbi:MAG: AAA family ATPase [Aliidongia sp.]